MTVLQLLRPHTSYGAQQRGLEYVDRVTGISANAGSIVARVRGGRSYDVEMIVERDALKIFCSCPYFVDRAAVCKHLWATAIVADERGFLVNLPGDLALEFDLDEDALADYAGPRATSIVTRLPDGSVPRVAPEASHRGPSRADAEAARALGALDLLTARTADTLAGTWPSHSRLVYVINAPDGATLTELPLTIERQDKKKNGDWSRPQPARLYFTTLAQLPDEEDRWALSLIYAASAYPRSAGGPYGMNSYPLGPVYLHRSLVDLVLPRLCTTGRVRFRHAPGPYATRAKSDDDRTLHWDVGEPWRFALSVTMLPAGTSQSPSDARGEDRYQVGGWLERAGEREDVRTFTLLTDSVAIRQDSIARCAYGNDFSWAAHLRAHDTLIVPSQLRQRLVAALARSSIDRAELPESLRWTEQNVAPRFEIAIAAPAHFYRTCPVVVAVAYGPTRVPLGGDEPLVSVDGTTIHRRDIAAEQHARSRLQHLGVSGLEPQSPHGPTVPEQRVSTLVRALLEEGWNVEAEGVRYRALAAPRLRVRSGIDWFELDAVSDSGEPAVDIGELLRALTSGKKTITLGDGTTGMLPEEWLARVAPVLAIADASADGVRFRKTQAALIDALLAGEPLIEQDTGFAQARTALAQFEGVRAEEPPPSFVGSLREYQRESLGWMQFLRDFGFGGCLADDMGLGKTVMVLAMLDARRVVRERDAQPSLVVLPRSLLFNWQSEASRFTPELRVLDFAHADRHSAATDIADADLVLTTYGTLRRDIEVLREQPFDYVILDEAQAIKNANTTTAKAVRLLRATHRLALTGTPVENHLGELHSLFDFLNPGLLGKGKLLTRKGKSEAAALNPTNNDDVQKLAKGLRPFFLRRTKEQVAPELPPRTEETLFCELEGAQRKLYEELRQHYRRILLRTVERQGMAKSTFQVLEALLRLRQAACHTGLLSTASARPGRQARPDDHSAKFDVLLPRLQELIGEGRKALVFSQFTSLLALLRARLDEDAVSYLYLDGSTSDRAAIVQRFQEERDESLFLISLKAGGVGLNLTAAEYVFLLDPWWNPAVEAQAIDRTHRIGQSRPVFAYRLVARNTVEERILELQSRKRQLADAILAAGSGGLSGLQRQDLDELLS